MIPADPEGDPGNAFSVLPRLQVLELYKCTAAVNDWLVSFMCCLRHQPEWEAFRTLSIESCSGIGKDELLNVVPAEVLEWNSDDRV